ncbi:MAG: hypothetical protein MI810_02140 [Flavobacteriales bacterium]|nr:hypothetical protein [Flavobacteriales bacterium]
MNKQIKLAGIIGVLGALIMFAGDMLLYFTTEPISNFEEELVNVMGGISESRLFLGGILGPFAACMYVFGFYQVYLAIKPTYKKLARIVFGILSVGIVFGGAFHSHFTFLGIMSSQGHTQALEISEGYSILTFSIMFIPGTIAYITLAYLILTNKTYYSKWMVLFSPIVLFWFSGLMELLPQPFMMIFAGGWSNIVFIIFFSVSSYHLLKHKRYEEVEQD